MLAPINNIMCVHVHVCVSGCSLKLCNEPRHEKASLYAYAGAETRISCAVTAQLIVAFDFAIRIVQFLYYLNPKFQASKVFSQRGSSY